MLFGKSGYSQLYQAFVELMNEGWDLAKQVQRGSEFGPAIKGTVLERVAEECQERRIKRFTKDLFFDCLKYCFKATAVRERRAELLAECLRDGLVVRSAEKLVFAHLSLQEFLAASSLVGEPGGARASEILKEYLRGDDWWLEVLRFYVGLSRKPHGLAQWFEDTAERCGGAKDFADNQAGRLYAEVRRTFPGQIDWIEP